MVWPYQFPHPADVIAEEAERFRRLSASEQVRQIVELSNLASQSLAHSPRRSEIEAAIAESEAAWRTAHLRVFEQHRKSENGPVIS